MYLKLSMSIEHYIDFEAPLHLHTRSMAHKDCSKKWSSLEFAILYSRFLFVIIKRSYPVIFAI